MIFVLPSKIEAIQRNFKERPLSTSLTHNCPFCFHFLEAVLPAWCFHQALDLCGTYETCLCVVHTCVEYMCIHVYVHGHIEVRERRHWLSPIPILPSSPLPVPLKRVLSLNLEPVAFRLTWWSGEPWWSSCPFPLQCWGSWRTMEIWVQVLTFAQTVLLAINTIAPFACVSRLKQTEGQANS